MDKIHIVTAGDSFTEGTLKKQIDYDPFDFRIASDVNTILNSTFYFRSLATPNSNLKYNAFLLKEVKDLNLYFTLHNIGITSSGNHIIAHFYKTKIKQLLSEGVNPNNIIGTIQLSALVRPKNLYFSNDIPGIEFDYLENWNAKTDVTKELLEKHIENIEELIKFNLENGITKFKIFHGWSIFFKEELEKYDLYDRLKNINTNYYWYESYPTQEDLLMTSCVGEKKVNWKLFIPNAFISKKEKINAVTVYGDEFGGMTEYCRKNLGPEDYYYCSITDAHLNSFGNNLFYNNIYRKWLVEWGVVDSENVSLKNKEFKFLLECMDNKSKQEFYDTAYYDFSDKDIISKFNQKYLETFFSDFNNTEIKLKEKEDAKLNKEMELRIKEQKRKEIEHQKDLEKIKKREEWMRKDIERNIANQIKTDEKKKKEEPKQIKQSELENIEIQKKVEKLNLQIKNEIEMEQSNIKKLEIEVSEREEYLKLKRTQLNKMILDIETEIIEREKIFAAERKRLDDYNYELGCLIGKKEHLIEKEKKEIEKIKSKSLI